MAHFEIYVLNYNGEGYLTECLNSLAALNLASHSAQINLVDNGSTDGSAALVKRDFPAVNFIALGDNFGFSKGNNLAVITRHRALSQAGRKIDFDVFLNNDTVVDPEWLLSAASAFEQDGKIGIVGSQSLFYHRFIPLRLSSSDSYKPSDFGSADTRDIALLLKPGFNGDNIHNSFRLSRTKGAYPEQQGGRWLSKNAEFFVALKDPGRESSVRFSIQNHNPSLASVGLKVSLMDQDKTLADIKIDQGQTKEINLYFKPDQYRDLIQNAGSIVTSKWEAYDRGFLEIDRGQFESSSEVDAICGVSMFIKHDLFQALGGFDQNFFAYFEDTDLSLRARLLGYKCWHEARSKLRHHHSGTAIENSDYFASNVAYSHLVFLSKLLPFKSWRQRIRYCREHAAAEFELFEKDRTLEGKAQLRAFYRYLRRWPKFLSNRIFHLLNRPDLKLSSRVNV